MTPMDTELAVLNCLLHYLNTQNYAMDHELRNQIYTNVIDYNACIRRTTSHIKSIAEKISIKCNNPGELTLQRKQAKLGKKPIFISCDDSVWLATMLDGRHEDNGGDFIDLLSYAIQQMIAFMDLGYDSSVARFRALESTDNEFYNSICGH